jgi:hypothetical protein
MICQVRLGRTVVEKGGDRNHEKDLTAKGRLFKFTSSGWSQKGGLFTYKEDPTLHTVVKQNCQKHVM